MNKQLSYLESVEVHKEIVRYYRKEALLEATVNAICFCILDGICSLIAGDLAISYSTVIAGIVIFAIMLIILQCITSCTISREEKLVDTTANIEKISSQNAVIVCTLKIYVKGEVWTLAYDGTAINNVDKDKTGKTGIKIFDDGPYKDKVYTPPVDPKTGKFTTDPIVSVYSNDHTSADDLRTEGSH